MESIATGGWLEPETRSGSVKHPGAPLEAEVLYLHIVVQMGKFKANISPLPCSRQLFLKNKDKKE